MSDTRRLAIEILQLQRSAAMLSTGQPFTLEREQAWDLFGRMGDALAELHARARDDGDARPPA